jgi:hypothetical protein
MWKYLFAMRFRDNTRPTSMFADKHLHMIQGGKLIHGGRFLGEETYAKGQSRDYLIDEQPTWCIDPLDGKPHPDPHYIPYQLTPCKRNRKLHPPLPNVLHLNRVHRIPPPRARGNLRPLPRPALLSLQRSRRLAERDTPSPADPEPINPAHAAQCARAVYPVL